MGVKVGPDYPYSYLGGSLDDSGTGIAVDQESNAYVCGYTYSSSFPGYRGGTSLPDAFVAKISRQNGITSIAWSLCLGGWGADEANGLARDSAGNLYVTGWTYSSSFENLPATPLYPSRGGSDAFVAKIREVPTFPSGVLAPLVAYFTFLGGTDYDRGDAIAVDAGGCAHVTGFTLSADFPARDLLLLEYYGSRGDMFVAKLNPAGTALVYATRLVTDSLAEAHVALDSQGNAYVTGTTNNWIFPTRLPWQSRIGGKNDAFVTKLSPKAVPIRALPKALAFYPFDGTGADTLKDLSGHGRDATLSGAAATDKGFEGQAYSFDGSSSFIQAPVDINPSKYPRLTMGCWARAQQVYSDSRFVLTHDNGGYDRSINIDTRGGGTGWSAFCGNGGAKHVLYGGPVTPGKWTFLCAVYDQMARTVKFYVDENVVTMANASLGAGNGSLRLGAYPTDWGYFGGEIDNVFVYGTALSDAQIGMIRDYGASALRYAPRCGRGLEGARELLLGN